MNRYWTGLQRHPPPSSFFASRNVSRQHRRRAGSGLFAEYPSRGIEALAGPQNAGLAGWLPEAWEWA
jgi:hypothetical protein